MKLKTQKESNQELYFRCFICYFKKLCRKQKSQLAGNKNIMKMQLYQAAFRTNAVSSSTKNRAFGRLSIVASIFSRLLRPGFP